MIHHSFIVFTPGYDVALNIYQVSTALNSIGLSLLSVSLSLCLSVFLSLCLCLSLSLSLSFSFSLINLLQVQLSTKFLLQFSRLKKHPYLDMPCLCQRDKAKQKEVKMGNFSKTCDTSVWKWPCLYFCIGLV
jgi:hypothetical protein